MYVHAELFNRFSIIAPLKTNFDLKPLFVREVILRQLDPETEKKIDSIIIETNGKLEAIVEEMRTIKSSNLDEVTKHEKTNSLRREFGSVLNEQQKRVEKAISGK